MSSSHTETDPAAPRREAEEAGGTLVVMPQMGVSVAEGTIAEWLKQVGDEVAADETICVITTDKIDVEIPAPASGVVSKIVVEEGETVPVGTLLAEIGGGGGLEASGTDVEAAGPVGGSPPNHLRNGVAQEVGALPPPPAEETAAPDNGGRNDDLAQAPPARLFVDGEIDRSQFYSPVVRRIAAEYGVDLRAVEGHGVGGRVRKADLAAFIDSGGSGAPEKKERVLHSDSPYVPETTPEPVSKAPSVPGADPLLGLTRREPLTPMRKAIGAHMVESLRTSPHCTTIVEADFSAVTARRAELKEAMGRRRVNPTYLAFVALATVEALQRFPVLNASIDGDEVVFHEDVNLGIAVALEQGLVVPVIRQAQRLSLEGMAAAIGDVAERARSGKLAPDDIHGGTFTITNPGQFGAVLATPIINQPQVAILDLEAVVRRPVVVDDDAGGEAIAVRPMSYLCMSWDHRALDGAQAARFLGAVRERIEAGVS